MYVKDDIMNAVNKSLGSIHRFKEGVTVKRNPLDKVKVFSLSEFLECRLNFEMFGIPQLDILPILYDGNMWLLDYMDDQSFRSFTECKFSLNLDDYNPYEVEKNELLNDLMDDLDGDSISIMNTVRPPMICINYR
jgi:hypothetical protein